MTYNLTTQDIERTDSLSRWFCSTKHVLPQNREDYLAVGRLGLVRASHDYIPNPAATFKTYAYHRVLGELKDYIRSSYVRHSKHPKAHTQAISLEQLIESGWEPSADGLEGRTINKDLCSKLLASLKPREQAIFRLYFINDYKMSEIGSLIQLTESRISQIIGKHLKLLRERAINWENTHPHQNA